VLGFVPGAILDFASRTPDRVAAMVLWNPGYPATTFTGVDK